MSHNGPNPDRYDWSRTLADPSIRALLACDRFGIQPTRYVRDRAARLIKEGKAPGDAVMLAYVESASLHPHESE